MNKTTYTVDAERFARWQKRKAAIAAAKRKNDAEEEALGLPKPEEFDAPTKGVIENGNGQAVAKFSTFHFSGATIPPGMRLRIS